MRGFATCLALTGLALDVSASRDVASADGSQRLAVVVPAYRGDLDRAVASLERWPTSCSPLTQQNVDLVLYYAEGEEDKANVDAAADAIAATAGRCFKSLRTVYAHLEKEEDAYPKGPSVMFFKMFLDEDVRSNLTEYDALAIIEWDVLVASDRSFEELYHAAFRVNEEFWVKGSNLEGTSLHASADVSDMWRVLGHINGNAIYNNNDPAFVEYVDYTQSRWENKYPYDVALWLTISDFPYSWPLYQRYSSKFVTTNLISYVGYEHVDHASVTDAVAGQTLFIHGTRVDDGSGASVTAAAAAKKQRKLAAVDTRWTGETPAAVAPKLEGSSRRLQADCEDTCETDYRTRYTGRLCDPTCSDEDPVYGTRGCKTTFGRYGDDCRTCYTDLEEAIGDDRASSRVIMCDTGAPPEGTGVDGCDTSCETTSNNGELGRVCDPSCTADDPPFGTLGCGVSNGDNCRFCYNDDDLAMEADMPDGNEDERAIMCDTLMPVETHYAYDNRRLSSIDNTAHVSRSLMASAGAATAATNEKAAFSAFVEEKADRPFAGDDVTRGSLCAFVAGGAGEVAEWTVTVESILQFAPGMKVAVAAEADAVSAYQRAVGGLPGVTVSSTANALTASLFADEYCGVADTSLIMYVTRGSVFSRTFTSKDTHSAKGDLLVAHSTPRKGIRDSKLSQLTASLIKSAAPVPDFTRGTDLMLPVDANAGLRELLLADNDVQSMEAKLNKLAALNNPSAVPQVLAALQFSRQAEGIWFVDPQAWVSQHLFKEASIWEIPLVKPRFTCAVSPAFLRNGSADVADVLTKSLDLYSRGGKCSNGLIETANIDA